MQAEKKKVKYYWEKDDKNTETKHDKRQMVRHRQDVFSQMIKPFGLHIDIKMPKMHSGVPINMSETEHALVIQAHLPGVKKEDVKVAITNNTFELSVSHKQEELEQTKTSFRKEFSQKAFHQSFTLPTAVDANNVSAKLEQGVLTVTMPKLESKKKKKVEIE